MNVYPDEKWKINQNLHTLIFLLFSFSAYVAIKLKKERKKKCSVSVTVLIFKQPVIKLLPDLRWLGTAVLQSRTFWKELLFIWSFNFFPIFRFCLKGRERTRQQDQ